MILNIVTAYTTIDEDFLFSFFFKIAGDTSYLPIIPFMGWFSEETPKWISVPRSTYFRHYLPA